MNLICCLDLESVDLNLLLEVGGKGVVGGIICYWEHEDFVGLLNWAHLAT